MNPIRLPSRPTWARGLKLNHRAESVTNTLSRPTWARGLKLSRCSGLWSFRGVAPHVGAWIETVPLDKFTRKAVVAPHVGAWIETFTESFAVGATKSRPTWARGLKPQFVQNYIVKMESRPTWARGLKPSRVNPW